MFFRVKSAQVYRYLQIAQSKREGRKVRQQHVATLGRLDVLQGSGQLERLIHSGARFCEKLAVIDARLAGETKPVVIRRIGPDLVFSGLWRETGIAEVLKAALEGRRYGFDVERAIYLTVLHRLFALGGELAAERWREEYRIEGAAQLELNHLYRAMVFLGEQVEKASAPSQPFRCVKDVTEEELFERRRQLFNGVDRLFCNVASLCLEGRRRTSFGHHDHRKNHRRDLKRLVIGMVLDLEGCPVCCKVWPGDTAEVTALVPVVESMRQRFRLREICVVFTRDMVSDSALEPLEQSTIDKQIKTAPRHGVWVLQTDTDYDSKTLAQVYKSLWIVEDFCGTTQLILDSQPTYHRSDQAIRGHVFCSFLALMLKHELERRMQSAGLEWEWGQVIRGLNAFAEVEADFHGKRFLLRSQLSGNAAEALRGAGATVPSTVSELP